MRPRAEDAKLVAEAFELATPTVDLRPSDEKAWKSYRRPGRRPKSSQDVQRCSSEVPGGRSRIVDWDAEAVL